MKELSREDPYPYDVTDTPLYVIQRRIVVLVNDPELGLELDHPVLGPVRLECDITDGYVWVGSDSDQASSVTDAEMIEHGWGVPVWETEAVVFTADEAAQLVDREKLESGAVRVYSVPAKGALRRIVRMLTVDDLGEPLG